MTLEEAQNKVNQIPFPAIEEGDVMWYPGKQGIDQPQSEWDIDLSDKVMLGCIIR